MSLFFNSSRLIISNCKTPRITTEGLLEQKVQIIDKYFLSFFFNTKYYLKLVSAAHTVMSSAQD